MTSTPTWTSSGPPLLRYGAAAVLRADAEARAWCAEHAEYVDRFGREVRLWRPGTAPRTLEVARGLLAAPLGAEGLADGHATGWAWTAKPRNDEQRRFVAEGAEIAAAGESFVAQAKTGFGKTVMTLGILARLGRSALVVVPKSDLVGQWVRAIGQHTTCSPSEVGLIREDRCDHGAGFSIVVGMLQSLAMIDRYPSAMYRAFGVVVFDEVHRIAADVMQEACWRFPARVRIGISATPNRKDGRMRSIRAHIGPVRVRTSLATLPFKVRRYETDWRCPRTLVEDSETGERTVVQVPHAPARTGHITRTFRSHAGRTTLVCRLLAKCHERGRKVVAFFDTLAHLERIQSLLVAEWGVPASAVGRYAGSVGSSANQRALLATALKRPVVLATYGMFSEGTDVPDLEACLFADPRSDVEQAVGRILRAKEGKRTPLVFDLVDSDSPVFRGYAERRLAWYRREGALVRAIVKRGT